MKQIIELLKRYREIISYLFWGVMTTIVSWFTYSLFVTLSGNNLGTIHVLGLKISGPILIANILSWICACSFAFVVNKFFVFRSRSWKKDVWLPEFWKFLSARLFTGILEIVTVPLLVGLGLNQTILGVEGMIAKVGVSVAVVILNYVFSKLFIF